MSKKGLGGRRHYWLNHGKSGVVFPFFLPNHAKAQTCDSDPKNKLEELFSPPTIGAVYGGRSFLEFWYKWG
jgi:hypothetical protein